MPITTETTALPTAAAPFRLRDMVMPEKLLERTNWRDNPLIVYSERRAKRPVRFVLIRFLEIVLLYCWASIISFPFSHYLSGFLFFGFMRGDFISYDYSRSPGLVPSTPAYSFVTTFILIFLLLRYHLLINDQSNHMKTLSREKLGELLLTRLGNEDYFLHHFLLFCLRYRVLIAWAAIWAVTISIDVITMGLTWIDVETLWRAVATLNIVLLTWVMGVYQYVTEWKWFAGGRGRALRIAYSLLFTAVLSAIVLGASAPWFWLGIRSPERLSLIGLFVALPAAVTVTCLKGRRMSAIAAEWLVARYQGKSIEFTPKWLRPLDPLSPWRWKSPFSPLICGEKSRVPGFRLFLKCLPYSILLFAMFDYFRVLQHSSPVMQHASYSWRLNWALHSFVVCTIGIWIGFWFKTEATHGNGRSMYLRALWWIGMSWLALYVLYNYRLIWNASLDYNGAGSGINNSTIYLITSTISNYVEWMIYLLFGFAVGALAPKRKSKSLPADFLTFVALCSIFFFVAYFMEVGQLRRILGGTTIASAIFISYAPFIVKYALIYLMLTHSIRSAAIPQPEDVRASRQVP